MCVQPAFIDGICIKNYRISTNTSIVHASRNLFVLCVMSVFFPCLTDWQYAQVTKLHPLMYNMCQSFNFFDVIEEYYASTLRQPRKNSMHFIKFSVCSCWKERFFCMCQWTTDIVKNNWK